ncbi:MAG: ribonuclease HII [Verrucomicrobiia bacterium]
MLPPVRVAGVDEAGRGCWAGPVVAAAFVFASRTSWPSGLNDSKRLSRPMRVRLYAELVGWPGAVWAVGWASAEEIDRLNILGATALAMRRALEGLGEVEVMPLVDGRPIRALGREHRALVGGDGKSPSVAAASVLAKETRDRMMEAAEEEFPGYGFAQHKGYGTARHQAGLDRLGPCPLHRRTFAPVREAGLPGFFLD